MDGTGRGPREPRGGAVCCTLKQIAGPQNRPSLNRQLGRWNRANYQVPTASVGLRLVRPVGARPVREVMCTAGKEQGKRLLAQLNGAVQGPPYGRRQKLRNPSTLNPAGHILSCKGISQRDDQIEPASWPRLANCKSVCRLSHNQRSWRDLARLQFMLAKVEMFVKAHLTLS